VQNVRTNSEPHSERLHVRLTRVERDSLDLLVQRFGGTRSQIIRSVVIGATLSELDQLEALDALEPSFDPLADLDDAFGPDG
jgi:hypothetical protein